MKIAGSDKVLVQMTRRDAMTVMAAAGLVPLFEGKGEAAEAFSYATMRRCGQTNFNERDPIDLDIAWWIRFWKSMRLDAVLINGGGIMAFYPTQIPYHHRSQFLGSRDLFGDFLKAAKAESMRVVARMDCNYVYEEAFKARPEWIQRNWAGAPVTHAESPWLYQTCMHTSYFTEQMLAISSRDEFGLYDVDGYFTEWLAEHGGASDGMLLRGKACQGAPDLEFAGSGISGISTVRFRNLEAVGQGGEGEEGGQSVYVGNLGGGIRAVLNLSKIGKLGLRGGLMRITRGRSGTTPIWDCAQQGRCGAVGKWVGARLPM